MTGYPASRSGARMASDLTIDSSDRGVVTLAKEGVDDLDKPASFVVSAPARRSTSSFGAAMLKLAQMAAHTTIVWRFACNSRLAAGQFVQGGDRHASN